MLRTLAMALMLMGMVSYLSGAMQAQASVVSDTTLITNDLPTVLVTHEDEEEPIDCDPDSDDDCTLPEIPAD